jgi:hypothetical protein
MSLDPYMCLKWLNSGSSLIEVRFLKFMTKLEVVVIRLGKFYTYMFGFDFKIDGTNLETKLHHYLAHVSVQRFSPWSTKLARLSLGSKLFVAFP